MSVDEETSKRKKHCLSPLSVDSDLRKEKQSFRTKLIEKSVIVRSDPETNSTILLTTLSFQLPPPPPLPKKFLIHKIPEVLSVPSSKSEDATPCPIIRPICKGFINKISCENGSSVTGEVKGCQVKRSSRDYQK